MLDVHGPAPGPGGINSVIHPQAFPTAEEIINLRQTPTSRLENILFKQIETLEKLQVDCESRPEIIVEASIVIVSLAHELRPLL